MNEHNRRRWRTTAPKQMRAQQLRREQTAAEALLWEQLRSRRLDGHKFRRQHPLQGYIVDFCCVECNLIVEVDGAVHDEPAVAEADAEREAVFQALGYRVIRFTNDQVQHELASVLESLRHALNSE